MLQSIKVAFWCACVLCSCFGAVYANVVFKNKSKKKIFVFVYISFICCVMLETSTVIISYIDGVWWNIIKWISLTLLVQIITWLYCWRITSLGGRVRFDSLLKYIPVLYIPLNAIFITLFVMQYVTNFQDTLYLFLFFPFYGVTIVVELYLFFVLISKIHMMLEYRQRTKKIIIRKLIACYVIIFILEFFILFDSWFIKDNQRYGRGLSFAIRTTTFIDFYNDIIKSFVATESDLSFLCISTEASSRASTTS